MKILISVFLSVLFSISISAQKDPDDQRANTPITPFNIIGNIYYVGAAEVTAFLVTTPKGHILVDAGYPETAAQIKANVARLGFKIEDIKYLVNTQAHYDHAGGFAEIKKLSGAKLIASPLDKVLLEAGGIGDFAFGDRFAYEAVMVDRVIKDGGEIKLGGVTLRAVFTPGHTKGCTVWTMDLTEKGRKLHVAFIGSTSSPGYKFLGNTKYPNIIPDYEYTFDRMKKLPVDVFLASHGSFFELLEKAEKIGKTRDPNPFIDPDGYKQFVTETEKVFRDKIAAEKAAAKQ